MRALRGCSDAAFEALCAREGLSDVRHALNRERQDADFTMSADMEKLATDLGVDGMQAWGRLYTNMTSKLTFPMKRPDGTTETLPSKSTVVRIIMSVTYRIMLLTCCSISSLTLMARLLIS